MYRQNPNKISEQCQKRQLARERQKNYYKKKQKINNIVRKIGEHAEIIEATVNKSSVIFIKKHLNYVKESDKPIVNKTSIESVKHLDYITESDPPIVIKSSIKSIGYASKLDKPIIESIYNIPESNKPIISNETVSNTIGSEAKKAKTQVNQKRRLECHELGRMD
ncbi:1206_t:CDS:1 [Acaulospora morrowiae]|uniref:1206_t:CDS:1 n=1 Tax=Acaulospora morrowiae TaxID=94023 RepID=A0A9N8ZV10_9GLOM|nr:1206_t:CDS:1 [Acaulospora morrowiae]